MSRATAVVLTREGLASAVLAYLLGQPDPTRAPRKVSSLPSALREARGLVPEGYALHLLTIADGQQPGPQAQHAARLIAALLDASYPHAMRNELFTSRRPRGKGPPSRETGEYPLRRKRTATYPVDCW